MLLKNSQPLWKQIFLLTQFVCFYKYMYKVRTKKKVEKDLKKSVAYKKACNY